MGDVACVDQSKPLHNLVSPNWGLYAPQDARVVGGFAGLTPLLDLDDDTDD